MHQGKLEVVKQEMARMNINILGISELKQTRMGQFNSDNHYIYYCGQESTELYRTDLHDPDNRNGMITHLEPDILECEVKWALGSITMNKASGGDGIPAISNPER